MYTMIGQMGGEAFTKHATESSFAAYSTSMVLYVNHYEVAIKTRGTKSVSLGMHRLFGIWPAWASQDRPTLVINKLQFPAKPTIWLTRHVASSEVQAISLTDWDWYNVRSTISAAADLDLDEFDKQAPPFLAICRKSRAHWPVSRLQSVPACAEQGR